MDEIHSIEMFSHSRKDCFHKWKFINSGYWPCWTKYTWTHFILTYASVVILEIWLNLLINFLLWVSNKHAYQSEIDGGINTQESIYNMLQPKPFDQKNLVAKTLMWLSIPNVSISQSGLLKRPTSVWSVKEDKMEFG